MTRFVRKGMTTLALVISTLGMTLAASTVAQASIITNAYNRECLETRSWTHAQQLRTRACNGSKYQNWTFNTVQIADEPETYYTISNAYNGMCVDVGWGYTHNGAKVVQAQCHGGDNQLWKRERTWNGTELLRVRQTGFCLDISWGNAVHWECNGAGWQQFRIT